MKINAFLVFILLLGIPAISAERIPIAVMDFDVRDVQASEAEKLALVVRNELSASGDLQVFDRGEMEKAAPGSAACRDVLCAVQAGRQMGAKMVMVGTLIKLGDQLTVTCRVIDVGKGTVLYAGNERALGKPDELYMAERLSGKVFRALTGKNLYAKDTAHREFVKTSYHPAKDPFAWIALGSGLACAWGFAIAHNSYEWRTKFPFGHGINDMFNYMLVSVSMDPNLYALALLNDFEGRRHRRQRAEYLRERNYYICAGVGGFSAAMLITFIGRTIAHTVSAGNDAKSGDVAFVMPSWTGGPTGDRTGGQFTIGMGLSMKF